MADIDLGTVLAHIQLDAAQLEQTADMAVAKLRAVGEQGVQAQKKISPLSPVLDRVGTSGQTAAQGVSALSAAAGSTQVNKFTDKLLKLTTGMDEQRQVVSRLGAELDAAASAYVALVKSAGRSGNIDLAQAFPAQTAALDKEIAKLEELQP